MAPNHSVNDQYEGFSVDLMNHIARKVNFTYVFNVTNDKTGAEDKETKQWNGMIGEIVKKVLNCEHGIAFESDNNHFE